LLQIGPILRKLRKNYGEEEHALPQKKETSARKKASDSFQIPLYLYTINKQIITLEKK